MPPAPAINFLDLLSEPRPGDALAQAVDERPDMLSLIKLAPSIPAGPAAYHSGSLLDHIRRCMNETAGDAMAAWMALCHDSGKLTTPAAMLPHHYNHECRGETIARLWARELSLPGAYADAGALAAREHMKAGIFARLRPGKKLALLEATCETPLGASFWRLVNADTKSRVGDLILGLWPEIASAKKIGMTREKLIGLTKGLSSGIPLPKVVKTP